LNNKDDGVINAITGTAVQHSIEIEKTIHQAFKEFMLAMPSSFAEQVGASVHHFGDVTNIALRELPGALFNQAIGLGIYQPAKEQDIDVLISLLQQYANPAWAISLAQGAQPAELPEWLEKKGLKLQLAGLARFWRDPVPAPEIKSTLTVRKVGPELAERFSEVITEGFGFPPHFRQWFTHLIDIKSWHSFLAYEGEDAIATGSMYIDNDLVWFGCGTTLEAHRSKGAQNLLLAHRIEQALKAQVRGMLIDTGHPGEGNPIGGSYRNILRAGFELSYVQQRYTL